MSEDNVAHRFAVLCQITRAQHFAWRAAVVDMCPDVDPTAVVERMWQHTGEQTGGSYARRLDQDKPLSPQVASSIVWSSECMGEDAVVEIGAGPDEAFVRHSDCPWFHWHKKLGMLEEDRPGCDAWFQTTVKHLNQRCGTTLQVETLKSLPDGDDCCLRRFWVEAPSS